MGREVALWTDSFDTKQAPTLGPLLVRCLSHLPPVHDVGLSVPRVEFVKNTGVETLLTGLGHAGLARKVPTDVAAKLWDMLGPSVRRKAGSEGFAAYGIRLTKCRRELGQALKRLDITLDASKIFHPGIRGIQLLEKNGLVRSEVSAFLATQEDRQLRVRSCHEWTGQAVSESSTLPARPRPKKSHAHCSDGWSSEPSVSNDEVGEWENS